MNVCCTTSLPRPVFPNTRSQLLTNARKFCDVGYVGVSVSMSSPNSVKIEISDSGCGIPKSFWNSLFQPYRQADTKRRQGTGLGLSIVKQLLEKMDGTVTVDSVEGEGTTFTVTLPTTCLSPSGRIQHSHPPKRLKVVYNNPKVAAHYVDVFNLLGFVATLGNLDSTMSDLIAETDIIWTNAPTLHISPSLFTLVSCKNHHYPLIFLVQSGPAELKRLDLPLSFTPSVTLVKRPVITHSLLTLLEGTTSLPPQAATSFLQSGVPSQPANRGRVLIAEDNPVRKVLPSKTNETVFSSAIDQFEF